MIWMNSNEETGHELGVEEEVAEEPSLMGIWDWRKHSPGISSQGNYLRNFNFLLDVVSIGVICIEGEEHGAVVPGDGVLCVHFAAIKADSEVSIDILSSPGRVAVVVSLAGWTQLREPVGTEKGFLNDLFA